MKKFVTRLGRNYWLLIAEILSLLSIGIGIVLINNNVSLQGKNTPWIWIAYFSAYNILTSRIGKNLIFSNMKYGLEENPPLRPYWKWSFVLLYTPYLAYSIWLGFVSAIHGIFFALLFTAAMCFILYCAYLRLSMDE